MTQPVVVAVDGSEESRGALRLGIAIATRRGAPLRLVHVEDDHTVITPLAPFPASSLTQIAEAVMREALRDVRSLGWHGEEPETVQALPPRVPTILEHARDASFVVLGTRSALVHHLVAGSTTSGVAAHSAVPVICVPSRWDPQVHHARVAVGADAADHSPVVVAAAADVAQEVGAGLVVMHAWRPSGQYDAAIFRRAVEDRWEQQTRPFVEALVDQVGAGHPDLKVDVQLRYSRPVVALHELSQSCDLLVIGRHTHHGPISARLGSTARTVIRTSECPVLVVPTA